VPLEFQGFYDDFATTGLFTLFADRADAVMHVKNEEDERREEAEVPL